MQEQKKTSPGPPSAPSAARPGPGSDWQTNTQPLQHKQTAVLLRNMQKQMIIWEFGVDRHFELVMKTLLVFFSLSHLYIKD